jgi:hypothetical protein
MDQAILEQRKLRMDAMIAFEQARTTARWRGLWARLIGTPIRLIAFGDLQKWLPQQRLYRGVHDIPLNHIVGSINRSHEFDRRFLPLRDTLAERWVNVMVLAHTTGCPPIQVYKIGHLYFVEDGHHRVSVARWLKNSVIEAEIWEYPHCQKLDPTLGLQGIIAHLKAQRSVVDGELVCYHG